MPLFFSYLCGGECLEDINTLVGHFRQRPDTLLPGADTVGRGLKELSEEDTLRRIMDCVKSEFEVVIERFRADCGSFSKEIVRTVEERCNTFYIRASWLFQSLRGVSQP